MSSKLLKKKTKKSTNCAYIWIWVKSPNFENVNKGFPIFCFNTLSQTKTGCLNKIFEVWFGDITKINRDICYAHLKRRNGKLLRIDFDKVFTDDIKL